MKKKAKKKRLHPAAVADAAAYTCPSCFERVDTFPDPGGGLAQSYVEDCPVCCRPSVLRAEWDEDAGTFVVTAEREG